jgi:hypothetical protein
VTFSNRFACTRAFARELLISSARTSVVPALDGGPRLVAGLCDGEASTGDVPRMRAERGRLQAAGVSTQHAVDAHPHRGGVSGSPIR